MIRITGGKLRGRSIESPSRSRNVRPTTALIRESVFSRLHSKIEGCRFLDLFAGSGIMGLEALSRGATFVLAVESDPIQCRAIRNNYATLGIPETQGKVIPYEVKSLLSKPCREEPFDVIFMDPPYGYADLADLTTLGIENGWIRSGGSLIVEHGLRDVDLPGFMRRNYGDSSISTLELP